LNVEELDRRELARLKAQAWLDGTKTQRERNKLGQFATPAALASDILRYAKALLPPDLEIRFLDPAFGTGSFYSALLRVFAREKVTAAAGYEVDPLYCEEATRIWGGTSLKLKVADFTRTTPPRLMSRRLTC
jgi:adenine-specific DNA-methyltransferase